MSIKLASDLKSGDKIVVGVGYQEVITATELPSGDIEVLTRYSDAPNLTTIITETYLSTHQFNVYDE